MADPNEFAEKDELDRLRDTMAVVNTMVVSLGDVLDRSIRTVEHADAIGWIHDPTAYRAGMDARQGSLTMMRALRDYRDAVVQQAEATGQALPG